MLKIENVIKAVKNGRSSQCIDGRDYGRLIIFFGIKDWRHFGYTVKDIKDQKKKAHKPRAWTRRNVLSQLKSDVAFGFEKALNQRGISASLMNDVVKMWMWVLEDDLQNHEDYAQYGLPLLKAVAVKYGFDNPIGEDTGNESKYAG